MRATLVLVLAAAVVASGCATRDTRYTHFGEPMKIADRDTIPIESLMASAEKYDGTLVRVSGVVDEVCQHKGCWITMKPAGAEDSLFVKFTYPVEPDARLIPLDAVGRPVIVEGKLTIEEISEDEAKHMAEDAGKSESEIAAIQGPQKRLRIASPAALIDMQAEPRASTTD